jgi:hypothetical protein
MRVRVRLMVAMVAAGAGWGAAPAAAAPLAGDYGGGAIAPGFTYAKGGRFVFVGARVDPGLGRVLVNARVSARCGSADITRRVALAADGSFTLRATVREKVQFVRRRTKSFRIVVFGRLDGAAGSGNARAKVTYRRNGRVQSRCTIRPQGFQLRARSAESGAGAARAGTVYNGLTGQRANRPRPFLLRVSRNGHRVVTSIFQYRRSCLGGRRYSLSNISPGARIRADGSFSRSERFSIPFSNAVERFRVRVHGRFTPGGVSGTLSVTSIARRRSDGAVIDRCRTGRVGFSAQP